MRRLCRNGFSCQQVSLNNGTSGVRRSPLVPRIDVRFLLMIVELFSILLKFGRGVTAYLYKAKCVRNSEQNTLAHAIGTSVNASAQPRVSISPDVNQLSLCFFLLSAIPKCDVFNRPPAGFYHY
jgi:hypothetical protein